MVLTTTTRDKGSGKGDKKSQTCFLFRDHGNSHDREMGKRVLAERKEEINATEKSEGKGRPRSPGPGKYTPSGRVGSVMRKAGRSRSPTQKKKGTLCPFFLKHGSCKKGDGCDVTHALPARSYPRRRLQRQVGHSTSSRNSRCWRDVLEGCRVLVG